MKTRYSAPKLYPFVFTQNCFPRPPGWALLTSLRRVVSLHTSAWPGRSRAHLKEHRAKMLCRKYCRRSQNTVVARSNINLINMDSLTRFPFFHPAKNSPLTENVTGDEGQVLMRGRGNHPESPGSAGLLRSACLPQAANEKTGWRWWVRREKPKPEWEESLAQAFRGNGMTVGMTVNMS